MLQRKWYSICKNTHLNSWKNLPCKVGQFLVSLYTNFYELMILQACRGPNGEEKITFIEGKTHPCYQGPKLFLILLLSAKGDQHQYSPNNIDT